MRDTRGHEDHLARLQTVRHAGEVDRRLALHRVHQRVVRRGVLAQLLPRVEGEQRDIAGLPLDEDPAHDGSVLVRDEIHDPAHLRLIGHGSPPEGSRRTPAEGAGVRRVNVLNGAR